MAIKVTEFDGVSTGNTYPIHLVQHEIALTAPADVKINWEYPGYISIVLSDGTEIAFGESLESDSGYSWNDFDREGNNRYADSFDDLKDIKAIVAKLWEQTLPIFKGEDSKNCGACGLFIGKEEQDKQGDHLANLCDANDGMGE